MTTNTPDLTATEAVERLPIRTFQNAHPETDDVVMCHYCGSLLHSPENDVFWDDNLNHHCKDMLIVEIRQVKAERDALKQSLEKAVLACGEQARARGEAEGKLAASEMAGVVDGWKARAEAAEAAIRAAFDRLDRRHIANTEHQKAKEILRAFLARHQKETGA